MTNDNKKHDKRNQDNLSKEQREKTGSLGGQARRDQKSDYSEMGHMQGQDNNPGNLTDRDKDEVSETMSQSGMQGNKNE